MSTTKHVVGSCLNADYLFPSNEEGQEVTASQEAKDLARELLGVATDAEVTWNLPDVFSIAYGSTFIGTASATGRTVEFHFEE
jgi:hypothetical protein